MANKSIPTQAPSHLRDRHFVLIRETVSLIFLCGRYECELDLYAERQRGTKNAFNIFMTLKVVVHIFILILFYWWIIKDLAPETPLSYPPCLLAVAQPSVPGAVPRFETGTCLAVGTEAGMLTTHLRLILYSSHKIWQIWQI
jgi:hypothetical protein